VIITSDLVVIKQQPYIESILILFYCLSMESRILIDVLSFVSCI
jgi:hypothetical protein